MSMLTIIIVVMIMIIQYIKLFHPKSLPVCESFSGPVARRPVRLNVTRDLFPLLFWSVDNRLHSNKIRLQTKKCSRREEVVLLPK
jgi:hypothetical protein